MKNIHVGVSLTQAYDMTWEEGSRPASRMHIHGWTDREDVKDSLNSRANSARWSSGGYGWVAQSSVMDADEKQSLPDTLYVVIYCSGVYTPPGTLKPSYGGGHGSWGVSCAFVNREKAQAYIKTETKKWLWLWEFEVNRFKPTSPSPE